jgi:uncharacterized SAM-binding protein YcdF (DUF218 family)
MFFFSSKILWILFTPSSLLTILAMGGFMLMLTRWQRAGVRLAAAAVLALLFAGFSPLGLWLALPLELRFAKPNDLVNDRFAGVIVLGGVADERLSLAHGNDLEVNDAAERILGLIALARRFPEKPVFFTGGTANVLRETIEVEADAVRRRIAQYGVPAERIIFENRSRNTFENALYSKPLLPDDRRPWLLVTSAMHMPRAMGVFRQAGVDVAAYPVDYSVAGADDIWRFPFAASEGLERTDAAMREWIGLIAYHLTGKTATFFPGP